MRMQSTARQVQGAQKARVHFVYIKIKNMGFRARANHSLVRSLRSLAVAAAYWIQAMLSIHLNIVSIFAPFLSVFCVPRLGTYRSCTMLFRRRRRFLLLLSFFSFSLFLASVLLCPYVACLPASLYIVWHGYIGVCSAHCALSCCYYLIYFTFLYVGARVRA